MNTQQVADRLVALCKEGKNHEAIHELYAENCNSYEPSFNPVPETKGLDAIKAKSQHFSSMIQEKHSGFISEPIVQGNHFTVGMGIDYTGKDNKRTTMNEIAVYEVKEGKIVNERYYY